MILNIKQHAHASLYIILLCLDFVRCLTHTNLIFAIAKIINENVKLRQVITMMIKADCNNED